MEHGLDKTQRGQWKNKNKKKEGEKSGRSRAVCSSHDPDEIVRLTERKANTKRARLPNWERPKASA